MYVIDKGGKRLDTSDAFKLRLKCGLEIHFECGLDQSAVLTKLHKEVTGMECKPHTIAGLPLKVRRDHPDGEITAISQDGRVIGKIVNLEKPELC